MKILLELFFYWKIPLKKTLANNESAEMNISNIGQNKNVQIQCIDGNFILFCSSYTQCK